MTAPVIRCTLIWHKFDGMNVQLANFEPDGWRTAKIIFERDPERHSLVKFFEVEFGFFGDQYDFLIAAEDGDGMDAKVTIGVQVQFDPYVGWETLFYGLVDLKALQDISDEGGVAYLIKAPITQTDLWRKFITRYSTPVDVQSSTDLDGVNVPVVTPYTLDLPSQIIDKNGLFAAGTSHNQSVNGVVSDTIDLQSGGTPIAKNEIQVIEKTSFIPIDFTLPNINVKDFGSLDITLAGTTNVNGTSTGQDTDSIEAKFFAQKNDDAPVEISSDLVSAINNTVFNEDLDLSGSHTFADLIPGDKIYLWIQYIVTLEGVGDLDYDVAAFGISVTLLQKTTFPDSTSPAMLIHDVGYSILDRIVGAGKFFSAFMGHQTLTERAYAADGCAFRYADVKGNQLRGRGLSDRRWFETFQEWYEGLDRVFMLGCGVRSFNKTYVFDESFLNEAGIFSKTYFLDRPQPAGNYEFTGSVVATEDTSAGSVSITVATYLHGNQVEIVDSANDPVSATVDFDGSPYALLEFDAIVVSVQKIPPGPAFDVVVDFEFAGISEGIEIENREKFFDASDISVPLTGIKGIIRSHDLSLLTKKTSIGYPNWKSEAVGVLDDPQTVATYASRYERSGEERPILSNRVAAGLVLEETRRKSAEPTKDWRFDDSTFLVSVRKTLDGGNLTPELAEDFTAISDLTNSSTRYNIRLWPVFNLLRHFPQLTIGMEKYLTSFFKFVSGEGNYKATATMDETTDCLMVAETSFAQDQDVPVDTEVTRGGALHSDELFTFTHPLSWNELKLIDENRNLAIGATSEFAADPFDFTFDETFHPDAALAAKCFIKRLEWNISECLGDFIVWKEAA